MKITELVKFHKSGYLGTILEVSRDFGGYAVIWIHGDVHFKNPTHMSKDMLSSSSEVISESR
jgi:hypothetical protein